MKDYLGYQGKVCVITGCASGIGLATAEKLIDLGAEVYGMDIKDCKLPMKKFIKTDLGDKTSIDNAFTQIPNKIDKFFGCAGITGNNDDFNKTVTVNFISNKYISEEYLVNRMVDNGAIAFISSILVADWVQRIDYVKNVVEAEGGWEGTIKALEAMNMTYGPYAYGFSKISINYYAALLFHKVGARKIRVNCLLPTLAHTGLLEFPDIIEQSDNQPKDKSCLNLNILEPEECADPLIFLNSEMARYIALDYLTVDFGMYGSSLAGIDLKQRLIPERRSWRLKFK